MDFNLGDAVGGCEEPRDQGPTSTNLIPRGNLAKLDGEDFSNPAVFVPIVPVTGFLRHFEPNLRARIVPFLATYVTAHGYCDTQKQKKGRSSLKLLEYATGAIFSRGGSGLTLNDEGSLSIAATTIYRLAKAIFFVRVHKAKAHDTDARDLSFFERYQHEPS